jgi:hypothetical protein
MFNGKDVATLGAAELCRVVSVAFPILHLAVVRVGVVFVQRKLLLRVEATVTGVTRVDEVRMTPVKEFGGQPVRTFAFPGSSGSVKDN